MATPKPNVPEGHQGFIDSLADQWVQAKQIVERSHQRLKQIENELRELVGFDKDEGTQHYVTAKVKVSFEQRVYRKVDSDRWLQDARPFFAEKYGEGAADELMRTKHECNLKPMRKLYEKSPQEYAMLAKCITVTPGSIGFKLVGLAVVPEEPDGARA